MNSEELVQELLDRGLESIQNQSVQFAKTHQETLTVIKQSQWELLRKKVIDASNGPDLLENVKNFLEHQQKRGERAGTTPWEKLAGPLIKKLESLPRDLQSELEACLKDFARQGRYQGRLNPSLGIELELYCQETIFTASRQSQWQFACLQGFLSGLMRLMRGKDIQKDHSNFFQCLG